jgi:peptidyl-prolyl cis-trans isomerase C
MKSLFLLLLLSSALIQAQNPPPPPAATTPPPEPITDSTVVGSTGDTKLTAAEVRKIVETLPPQMRGNYTRDPKGFLSQWFMLKRLVAVAEKQKLHEQAPYKEGIEIARMQVLWQAVIEETTKTQTITPDELKAAYEIKKNDFTQAMLKVIYIPFAASTQTQAAAGGKKLLTEPEALAKAEGLAKQARAGGDFLKLVAEHSEDPISKEKQGDFGPIKRGDRLPDAIKQAVFSLKLGQISDPVRQPNGYYIFRLQELKPQAFDEVKEAISSELKNLRLREWLDANAKSVELKVERPDFFVVK